MKPWQQTLVGFLLGQVVVGATILVVSPPKGQPIALVTHTPNDARTYLNAQTYPDSHHKVSPASGVYTLPENRV